MSTAYTDPGDLMVHLAGLEPARVRPIALSDERWAGYVATHPRGTVYHLPEWSAVLREAYRWSPVTLAIERGDRLCGVLPLTAKRGPVSGGRLRSLPVAPSAGPLADTFEDECALVGAAVELAARRRLALVVGTRSLGLEQRVAGLHAVEAPPSWILDVPDDPDAWLKSRQRRLVRGVRRAERDGVVVRPASDPELARFYELYLGTMRRHRHPPRSLSQLRAARRRLGDDVFHLTVAEREGRVIAGLQFHAFGDVVELLYNASDPSANDHRANHALYMDVVRWASARGFRSIDFGPAWPQTELAEFKRQWGAGAVPEVMYSTRGARAAGPRDAAPSRGLLRGWADGAWARTPLGVTAAVSRFALRYL